MGSRKAIAPCSAVQGLELLFKSTKRVYDELESYRQMSLGPLVELWPSTILGPSWPLHSFLCWAMLFYQQKSTSCNGNLKPIASHSFQYLYSYLQILFCNEDSHQDLYVEITSNFIGIVIGSIGQNEVNLRVKTRLN